MVLSYPFSEVFGWPRRQTADHRQSTVHSKGAFQYAKDSRNFAWNSNGKSVSVSSNRNIRDHLWRWSTYFGCNIPSEIRRSILANRFFALIREFGRETKSGKSPIIIGWPGLIGKCRSILLGNSHWSLTCRFGIMESTLCVLGLFLCWCLTFATIMVKVNYP